MIRPAGGARPRAAGHRARRATQGQRVQVSACGQDTPAGRIAPCAASWFYGHPGSPLANGPWPRACPGRLRWASGEITRGGRRSAPAGEPPAQARAGDGTRAVARTRLLKLRLVAGGLVAADGVRIPVRSGGQQWLVSWHPPPEPPDGTPHGAAGVCVTSGGGIVIISPDGKRWDLPAGRPEPGESWEQTLRREMDEEACATVVRARLLGFTRGQCVAGPERGLVLVRSVWRADVKLRPWEARFEIADRRVVAASEAGNALSLAAHPFAALIRRELAEAALSGEGFGQARRHRGSLPSSEPKL